MIRPPAEAYAQEDSNGNSDRLQMTVTYTYNAQFSDSRSTRTIVETYSGSAELYQVDGGFEGNSTADYRYNEDYEESGLGCTSTIEWHTTTFGQANMVVHYQFSIDNPITGGPDTSMYNSSYGVVEVLFDSQNLDWQENSVGCEGETSSGSGQDGAVMTTRQLICLATVF
jgi:hypothetical protein